jgi:Tol biopolymer transport system component
MSFFVNDHHLSTVTDDTFSNGYIGLMGGRKSESGIIRLAFDNLDVYGSAQAKAADPPTPTPQPVVSQPPAAKSGLDKIAFVSDRDGNQEIYVMNADGSGVTRLTNNPAEDHSPVWSPDGGTIAFVSTRDGNSEIYLMAVYLMAADGRGQTNLTENPANDYDPAWAGNGAKLVFTSSRDDMIRSDLWVMNSDGSNQTKLQNFGVSPAWSPDNSRIAAIFRFGGLTHLGVMPADGSADPQPLLQTGTNNFPAWSPGSQRLAFESAESPGNGEILVINANGSNLVNLTNNQGIVDSYPTWSSDGSRIAFVSDRDGNNEIYVVQADGSGVQRLTNHPAWDAQPNWSP